MSRYVVVWLASLTPRKELESFISKLPASTLVFIDEAYHHYAGRSVIYESFIDHPVHDERVIVARTFSKVYGLAGLRLGYAVAPLKLIQQMKKFATDDDINIIATEAVFAALNDADAVADFIERNANYRQEFFNQAMARSLKPIDSHANFVMMNTLHSAQEVIDHFCKHNILIGRAFPPIYTYIRVSLGLPEEMLAFWRTWDLLRTLRTKCSTESGDPCFVISDRPPCASISDPRALGTRTGTLTLTDNSPESRR